MAKKFQIFQEFPRGLLGNFPNLQYCGHNFGTRNARKSIKPLTNKNLSQKWLLVLMSMA